MSSIIFIDKYDNISITDSEFDGLCPNNKVCCEEKDIEIPPPPTQPEPVKPSGRID